MQIVAGLLLLVVWFFLILLFVRLVIDWIQVLARAWRPRGVMVVVAEVVYTITDPPLKALRRVIPPLTLGPVRLDLAFMVLVIICWLLIAVLGAYSVS